MDIIDSLEKARRKFARAVIEDDDRQEMQRRGRMRYGSAGHTAIQRHYSPPRHYEPARTQQQRPLRPAPRTPTGVRLPAGPLPLRRALSRSRAPAPRQPLVRAPSTHRGPVSQDAVYFREGSGYLYVKTLGNGVDGSAVLVRSVADGKLYVRKEEFSYEDIPRFHTPPEETTNALQVQNIRNTYRPHGWTRWVNSPARMAFNITYWQHYDLGSLRGFISDCRQTGRPIPERWGALWFVSMCDTMIRVQRAGVIHNDPHTGNWLVQSTHSGIPEVFLGDFGRSERREELSSYAYKNHCTSDFEYITSAICEALQITYDRQGHEAWGRDRWDTSGPVVSSALVAQLNRLAKISSRVWNSLSELHTAVLGVSAAVFEIATSIPGGQTHPAATPTPITYPYMTGNGLLQEMVRKPQGFKQWRHARVSGSRIATRSTGQCERLTPQAGQWYKTVQGNPVWRVD